MNEPKITYQVLFKQSPQHVWHINHPYSNQTTPDGVRDAIKTIREQATEPIHSFKVERTTIEDVTTDFIP